MPTVDNVLKLLKYWIDNHYHTNACATNMPAQASKAGFLAAPLLALKSRVLSREYGSSMYGYKLLYDDTRDHFTLYEVENNGSWRAVESWPNYGSDTAVSRTCNTRSVEEVVGAVFQEVNKYLTSELSQPFIPFSALSGGFIESCKAAVREAGEGGHCSRSLCLDIAVRAVHLLVLRFSSGGCKDV
jgi:hypothetical protein